MANVVFYVLSENFAHYSQYRRYKHWEPTISCEYGDTNKGGQVVRTRWHVMSGAAASATSNKSVDIVLLPRREDSTQVQSRMGLVAVATNPQLTH